MVRAKCLQCHASAIGDTFEEAKGKLNHAVGLTRGIKCRVLSEHIREIVDKTHSDNKKIDSQIKQEVKTKKDEPKTETVPSSTSKVESELTEPLKTKSKKQKKSKTKVKTTVKE